MKWNPSKIKELLNEKQLSVTSLADSIHVTRQTVHNWLKGSLPKGQDLLRLCGHFGVGPEVFFSEQGPAVTLVSHRTHRGAVTTPAKVESARRLASEYATFFKQARPLGMVPALLANSLDKEYQVEVAQDIRRRAGIGQDKPMNFGAASKLLSDLGVFAVFRDFPQSIKSYAFFCIVENSRVVFVDTKVHTLDLVFQMLHEAMHALRSDKAVEQYSAGEEAFCDAVACCAQFPLTYVNEVARDIADRNPPAIVRVLKSYALANDHSIHGIMRALETQAGIVLPETANIYPAEARLRKGSATVERLLSAENEPRAYWSRLEGFSPHFCREIRAQLDSFSDRKLAQLLGLPTGEDARRIVEVVRLAKAE